MKMNAEFYNLTQQSQGLLFTAMQATQADIISDLAPLPTLLQVRAGYAESPSWFMIQAAEFDPEPLTIENLRVRDIYASERIVQALLEMLAGERWLDRVGNQYHLTSAGRDLIAQLRARSSRLLSVADPPLPAEIINPLEARLGQIIKLSLQYINQPNAWCLAHSRNRAPATDAAPLQKINQYFSDFNAFRDDAHMAAWQAQEIDGYVWEAFSFICSGQAASANEVFEALSFRGFSRDEYAGALRVLAEQNWLVAVSDDSNHYRVTEIGRSIQDQVEQLTDAYFYAPWSDLADDEIAETQESLQQFHDQLQALADGGS